jgi:hypothetical protein
VRLPFGANVVNTTYDDDVLMELFLYHVVDKRDPMSEPSSYSILLVKGETFKGSPLADQIMALDRQNMRATLQAVGVTFRRIGEE